MAFGIIAIIAVVLLLYLFTNWLLGLNGTYGSAFSFQIELSNLSLSAAGLSWMLTFALVLFYLVAGAFLVMEGKVGKVEVIGNIIGAIILMVGYMRSAEAT